LRNGVVDLPDVERKNHIEPIAYLGGVAGFGGWLGGVVFGSYRIPGALEGSVSPVGYFHFPFALVFGATVIMVTGLVDDVRGISPRMKIGGQFLAAAALAWSSQNMGTELVADTLAAVGITVPFFVAYHLGAAINPPFMAINKNPTHTITVTPAAKPSSPSNRFMELHPPNTNAAINAAPR